MKKKYIMIVICIIAMMLVGCNSKEKQENASKEIATYDLKKGNYYSENDNSFIMLDVYHKEFVLAKEEKIKEGMSGDVYKYEVNANNLIATNEVSQCTFLPIEVFRRWHTFPVIHLPCKFQSRSIPIQ